MRGSQFVMNMKLTTSGTILVNRSTGIIKEKTTVVESSGQSEILGTNTPVNGKMTSTVTVRQKDN